MLSFPGAPCGPSEPGFGNGIQLKDVITAFKAAELLSAEFKRQPSTRHALDNKALIPLEWIYEESGQGALPFNDFASRSVPGDLETYRALPAENHHVITARNQRILHWQAASRTWIRSKDYSV